MREHSDTPQTMEDVLHPGGESNRVDPDFPQAPQGWNTTLAKELAEKEGLELVQDHWEMIRVLQIFYSRHKDSRINSRDLHDAIGEKFNHKGGLRYLYEILPAGPVAQGCRLAGLQAPAGAVDRGFGSVV